MVSSRDKSVTVFEDGHEVAKGKATIAEVGAGVDQCPVVADEIAVFGFSGQINMGGVAICAIEHFGEQG